MKTAQCWFGVSKSLLLKSKSSFVLNMFILKEPTVTAGHVLQKLHIAQKTLLSFCSECLNTEFLAGVHSFSNICSALKILIKSNNNFAVKYLSNMDLRSSVAIHTTDKCTILL